MNFTPITRFSGMLNADDFVSNGFLSYVCDVGLWFHFMKYGST